MDTLRILIVDDEVCMCSGVERALRKLTVTVPELEAEIGFEIQSVYHGQDALDALETFEPDLMLLDHKLPDMTGLDILAKLQKQETELLTVMITAYASLDTAVQATKQGAFDFLAKPFTPEEIRAVIKKAAHHLLLQRQAKRLAEEKRQVRFQFISVLAHEMKSPISAVLGYLRLMQDRIKGNDVAAYDAMLQRSTDRLHGMQKLISDLLDMTAIESGQKARDLQVVDLTQLIKTSIENFSAQAREAGITLHHELKDGVHIRGDRTELDIVINNLISNGIKYNRENGTVTVELEHGQNDGALIRVSDTGIGMSEQEQEKLFKDFSRIKNKKTRNILGSGLGLSTVKKIATLYNGDVKVESVPDEGSTFTVALYPLPEAEVATASNQQKVSETQTQAVN